MQKYLDSSGREKRKEFKLLYPERHKAREALKIEVRAGRMKRLEFCQLCGKNESRIEAHHHDYSKPLEVIWICAACHRLLHSKNVNHAERLNDLASLIEDAIVRPQEETLGG